MVVKHENRIASASHILGQVSLLTWMFILAATASPTRPSMAAEEEWQRSKPDVIVYLPKGVEHHDGDNEMFMVAPSGKSDELIGIWTQSSVEGRGDNQTLK